MISEIETYGGQPPREPDAIWRPGIAMDPARLEYLWKLSERMARSTIVPMSLRGDGTEGKSDWEPFDADTVTANVFAVVEQADRWGMSPFSLLLCASIIYGKLCFEGKVINGILETNYGIKLSATFSGQERTDGRTIELVGTDPVTGEVLLNHKGEPLLVKACVADWKTTRTNSPWKPADYDKMLLNRGSREWARMHKPAAILGIYSIDEIQGMDFENRAQNAIDKIDDLASRFKPVGDGRSGGFSPDNVKALTDARSDAQLAGAMEQDRPKETVPAGEGKTPAKEPAKAAAAKSAETQERPAQRLDRKLHEDFSAALLRVSKPDAIGKMGDEFWSKHGGWPPVSPADKELATKIAKAHGGRIDGKISIEDLHAHVAELIAESYGEGL